jgi:hypothetical protein
MAFVADHRHDRLNLCGLRQRSTDSLGVSRCCLRGASAGAVKPSRTSEVWCTRLPSPAPQMLRYLAAQDFLFVAADELVNVLAPFRRALELRHNDPAKQRPDRGRRAALSGGGASAALRRSDRAALRHCGQHGVSTTCRSVERSPFVTRRLQFCRTSSPISAIIATAGGRRPSGRRGC